MKIHTIVRLVLCITGISTGITQAMDAPKATPSLFKGLGSWLRIASTPNEKFKQSIVVMLGLGSGLGMVWTAYSYYEDWYKRHFHHQFEETKRAKELKDATYFRIKNENWDKVVKHNHTETQMATRADLASTIYHDSRNTCQFNSVFQSDNERIVSGIYQTCINKKKRIEYTITGNKNGISEITVYGYKNNQQKMQKNADVLKPYFNALYDSESRKTNAKHDLKLKKTQLDEKIAQHAKTAEFLARQNAFASAWAQQREIGQDKNALKSRNAAHSAELAAYAKTEGDKWLPLEKGGWRKKS